MPAGTLLGRVGHLGAVVAGTVGAVTSTRAPFQVLVIPFLESSEGFRFGLLRREDAGYWQGIAGGGEADETPLEAARREAAEEAGVGPDAEFVALDARSTMPVVAVTGEFTWGPEVLVIPEFAFGARSAGEHLRLSHEHTEYRWFDLDDAMQAVQWDSNRTALWELHHRLHTGLRLAHESVETSL